MKSTIVLAKLLQADGKTKLRPALVLGVLPPYNDFLICGISTQLHQQVKGFDERLIPNTENGLKATSIVRLGMLFTLPNKAIKGAIGKIPTAITNQLIERLNVHLQK